MSGGSASKPVAVELGYVAPLSDETVMAAARVVVSFIDDRADAREVLFALGIADRVKGLL